MIVDTFFANIVGKIAKRRERSCGFEGDWSIRNPRFVGMELRGAYAFYHLETGGEATRRISEVASTVQLRRAAKSC